MFFVFLYLFPVIPANHNIYVMSERGSSVDPRSIIIKIIWLSGMTKYIFNF
jgi:hypothetical protein